LLDAEPPIVKLANSQRGTLTATATRRLLATLRENLGTGVLRDLRTSLRLLVRERGFSVAAILTLAVCLGANAVMFTVVYSVLLRPLPIPEADRVVAMGDVYPTITPDDILSNDAPSYFDRLQAMPALEEQALFTYWFDTIAFDGIPEEIRGMRATPSLFRVLRVQPALGRTFTDDEGRIGAERKIVLSYGLWQRLYGGDPAAVGQDVRLGWTGQRYTIVGVMPRGFTFFDAGYDGHARSSGNEIQFWVPLAFTPAQTSDAARTRYGYFHIGRLRPGASREQAQQQVDALNASNVKRFPQFQFAELGMYTAVTPLQEALTRNVRRPLYLLWGGVGFLLLIGAINLANLALARASVRVRDVATRLALGASRSIVARQLIVEGLVLAVVGGVAAAGVADVMLRALASAGLQNLPNAGRVEMDWTVMAFIGAVSGLVGTLIGLVPAVAAGAFATGRVLADRNRQITGGRSHRLVRRSLIVTQVALSAVLLVGATLLLTSFRHLLSIDTGFRAEGVMTATIFPPPSRYPDQSSLLALSARILESVRGIRGVEAAGITSNIPLSGRASPATVAPADRRSQPGDAPVLPSIVSVSPGYFEAIGARLVRGRHFAASDREDTQRVAMVDQRLAARFWPGEDPIGKGIFRGDSDRYTVVGIVGNIPFESLASLGNSVGTAYFPHTQSPPLGRLRWIAARSDADAATVMRDVRAALTAIDPLLPLSDIQTLSERTSRSLVFQRLAMRLASLFAGVALFLSALGIYGVLAYMVARRTREIGIRMALGSTVRDAFRLVFAEGATLVAVGLLLGLAGSRAVARALEGHLFGVQPTDPAILATVVVATGIVAMLACVGPALRATRVNPISVLSEE
jgi:predicted permease